MKKSSYRSGFQRIISCRKLFTPLLLLLFINLLPQVVYSITPLFPITGSTNVCEGDVKTYSAPVSSNTYVWTVSSGNSFITNSNTNVVTWGQVGGSDFIELKVYNSGTLISQHTLGVTINGTPSPQITSDFDSDCIVPDDRKGDIPLFMEKDSLSPCHTVCEGMAVTYTTPLVAGNSYQWTVAGNFTGISNSSTNQATVTWGSPGQASITLTETTPQGCSTTETICIEIVAKPRSLFHVNNASGSVYSVTSGPIPSIDICMGDQVCFGEDATGESLYSWDFGNGTTSLLANDCATYNTPGSYLVKLTAENECHCIDESFIRVNVIELPGPDIVCTNALCENGTFSYNAILPNGACQNGTYEWVVSGNGQIVEANGNPITPTNMHTAVGVTSISVDWSSGPIGTISLRISGCPGVCSQFTNVDIPIIPSTINLSGKNILCVDEDEHFSVQCFPGTTYDWQINGNPIGETGNSIWYSFPNAGTYTLSVSYTNTYLGCTGISNSFDVQVLTPFEIIGADKICEGSTTIITDANGGNLNWIIKDNSGNQLTAAGTSQNGGSTFVIPSTLLAGNYTVIAYDALPREYCNEYAVHGINVIPSPPAPTVINGLVQICDGESYIYTSAPTSPNYYLKWEVLNNSTTTTSNGNSVTVNWSAGAKWIKLYQVSKENDCESFPDSLSIITKSLAPTTISGPTSVCANTSAMLPEVYSASPNYFDNYTWSISPATAGSVVSGQGTDQIGVIWNNTTGGATISVVPKVCTSTGSAVTYGVTVTPPTPFTISGPSTICEGTAGTWSTSLSGIFTWNIKNSINNSVIASGTGTPVNYTFNQNGSFVLIVEGAVSGCSGIAVASYNVVVNPAPVANLSYQGNINCISQSRVDFTVSVQGVPPYTYQWYNNSTLAATTFSPNNIYSIGPNPTDAGSWSVIITDANGCSSRTNIVKVVDNCSGGGSGPGCNPVPGYFEFDSTVHVINSCTDLDFNAISFGTPTPSNYVWQIANIATLTGPNPTFTFPASGIYPVSLITNYQAGDCGKTFTQDVLVPVQSDMDINIHCVSNALNIDLINTSNVVHGPLSLWNHQWKIFNGASQVGPTYNTQDVTNITGLTPGVTYSIRLFVNRNYTWNGQTINAKCRIVESFTMPYPAAAAFTVSPTPNVCEDLPVTFTDASTGDIVAWSWDFGDLSTITTQNPEKTYQLSGSSMETKNVVLTVTDEYGCTSSTLPLANQINVHPNTIGGSFTGIPLGAICPGTSVNLTFSASGSSGYSYLWTTGATASNITVGQTSNNYIYVADVNSCKREFGPAIVEVDEIPDPYIQGKDEYCDGEEIQLSCNYGTAYTYQWYRGGSAISGETSTTLNITEPIGNYVYTIKLTSATPCTKISVGFPVTVHSLPVDPIVTTNPTPACPSSPVTLTVTNPSNFNSVSWTNGSSGTSMTTTSSGVYYAVGTDANGCSSSASGEVFELPDFCGFMCGCYSDCIDNGATFTFPGITGDFLSWEWQEYSGGSWNTIASLSGSGAVLPFTTTTPGNYIIRLYVVTLNGCDGTSCEADISLTNCDDGGDEPNNPCEGHANMEYMECIQDESGNAQYNFILTLDYYPSGTPCNNFSYSIITPSGAIMNLSPGQLTAGSNVISGTWNTGVPYFPGQTVCFTVIVKNTCDLTECSYVVCYDVEPCGDESTGGDILPCNSGSAFINNVSCGVVNGKVQYNFLLNMNFVPFGDPCDAYNYSIVNPYGITLIYATPSHLTSGNYIIGGSWLTGLAFVPGQQICFDVILTNSCDGSKCKMTVCFDVPECGTSEIGGSERKRATFESSVQSDIKFYPNPVNNELNIILPNEGTYQIRLFDLSGRLMINQEKNVLSRQVVKLNVETLKPGIYSIQCIGDGILKNELIRVQ